MTDANIQTRVAPEREMSNLKLHLTVLSGAAKGKSVELRQTMRIGTSPDNDLALPDDTVSRHHCELSRVADGVRIRDLDSTNGTRVDGARVRDATFPPGTILRVGEVEIAVRPVQQALDVLPTEETTFGDAIGHGVAMRSIFAILERIAPTDATVLLQGETGTGKDVLARAISDKSPRASGPFVVVDCGAVNYSLIESELFGHERGSFTGAVAARQGAFELASGGTIFLDEIGELPLDVQPKLLRVLETRQFRRVGGNKTLATDVRLIAATKRDLEREVRAGKFREDLYFRLAVVPITTPPLRARREDIPHLVRHMLASSGAADLSVSSETLDALGAHDWPGNVRELRNVLERAVYMARASGEDELKVLAMARAEQGTPNAFHFDPAKSYRETKSELESEFERRYVSWLLDRHAQNVSAAAREARMDRKHLHDLAKKHGLRGQGD